jgi:hypothetical protein
MRINFSELNYDNLYPLTLKLENGNIYDGRFTDMRVDRGSIPKGLYAYDVRDCCDGEPCEVRSFVFVNHMGTLITTAPIPEAEDGDGYVVDYSFSSKEESDL